MKTKTLNIVFILFIALSASAALYHSAAFFYPVDKSPLWRHGVFIVVNTIIIYGLLKRPTWFEWFIALLTLQQWYSHGNYLLKYWKEQHSIHWISAGVIVLLPLLLLCLIIDRKNK